MLPTDTIPVIMDLNVTVFAQKIIKADSSLAPSQWETSLQSNAASHWLGANLARLAHSQWETSLQSNVVSHWMGANLESTENDYYNFCCNIKMACLVCVYGKLIVFTESTCDFSPYLHIWCDPQIGKHSIVCRILKSEHGFHILSYY